MSGFRGVLAAAEAPNLDATKVKAGFLNWRGSSRKGDKGTRFSPAYNHLANAAVPDDIAEKMRAELPPMIRRTSRERYRVLVNELVTEGMRFRDANGYIRWPKSVQDKLTELGWKDANPDLRKQVETLAESILTKTEHKQKENDNRLATTQWHGHYD